MDPMGIQKTSKGSARTKEILIQLRTTETTHLQEGE